MKEKKNDWRNLFNASCQWDNYLLTWHDKMAQVIDEDNNVSVMSTKEKNA